MTNLRGRVACFDMITVGLICGLSIPFAAVCVLLSYFVYIAIGVILGFLYLMFIGFFILCTWYWVPWYLRKAHFCLAVFLWAENNRYYMAHNCLLWPGFNGKWIEFVFEGHNVKKKVVITPPSK